MNAFFGDIIVSWVCLIRLRKEVMQWIWYHFQTQVKGRKEEMYSYLLIFRSSSQIVLVIRTKSNTSNIRVTQFSSRVVCQNTEVREGCWVNMMEVIKVQPKRREGSKKTKNTHQFFRLVFVSYIICAVIKSFLVICSWSIWNIWHSQMNWLRSLVWVIDGSGSFEPLTRARYEATKVDKAPI